MKVKIAFYRYNKKAFNAGISLWTWLFNPFTPAFSHVEIGVCSAGVRKYFSSTLRRGAKGTRWISQRKLFKYPERWNIYEIEVVSKTSIINRANGILGQPYDFAGLTGFISPFGLPNKKDKWYCSEACYYVLTGDWKKRISPRRFYSYIKKQYRYSIREVSHEYTRKVG